MPDTSAIVLLSPPSQSQVSTTSTSYVPTTDSSFQQSLESAQQRNAAKPDDSQPTKATNQPGKSDKKTSKRTKSVATVNKNKVQADSTDAPETEEEVAHPAVINENADAEIPSEQGKATAKGKPVPVVVSKDATPVVPVVSSNVAKTATPEATVPQAKKTPVDRKPAVVKSLNSDQTKDKKDDDESTDVQKTSSAQVPATAAAVASSPETDKSTAVKGGDFCTATTASATPTDGADAQAKPKAVSAQTTSATADAAELAQATSDILPADSEPTTTPHGLTQADGAAIAPNFEQQLQHAIAPPAVKAEAPAPPAPETQFVDANHPTIVTGVHSQLLPNGGTMQIRLDPPNLGALQVTVSMRDGVMTAAFETSNEQATRMLSHSLNQLKTSLELGGVSVEKMHVQQSPKQESNSGSSDKQNQSQDPAEQQQQARQEQQRRQMLQRMWNKLAGVEEPLDLVA